MRDLLDLIAYWWWLAPLVGAAVVAYRFLGWRGLLAVATLGLAGGLYTKGRQDERQRAEQQAKADRLEAIKDRKASDDAVNKLDPNTRRDDLRGWVSDDDPR
jgi:hypothetical protein